MNLATDFTIYYEIPDKYAQYNFSAIQSIQNSEKVKRTIGVTVTRNGALLNILKYYIIWYGFAHYAIGTEHDRILSELEEILSDFPELKKVQDFLMNKLVPFAKGQIKISEVDRQDLADEAAAFYKDWIKSLGIQMLF